MLRLLIVDDHQLFREAMAAQLMRCEGIEAVFDAADAERALEVFCQQRPDVVLMDVDMPGRDGLDTVRTLRAIDPECKVIILSGHEHDAYLEQALDLNVQGYVLKHNGLEVLERAIEEVAAGRQYFSESISGRMACEDGQLRLATPHSAAVAGLTHRERELLRHLGMGASLKEAAVAMDVSYKTADNHKASLMRKLKIHDRAQLVRFAIREGWVTVA